MYSHSFRFVSQIICLQASLIELFTDLKQSLEYTKFYEVDDINILILDKDTSKHKFLSKEKKDLYTYDGNNWQLDFPSYKLRINKLNFDYNLVGHYYWYLSIWHYCLHVLVDSSE